ncbi:MAG: sporulation protein [Candidatus Dojkabacteria bacterium]
MEPDKKIQEIIQSLEKSAHVKSVFGEPIEHNGIVIIPVASVKISGGGGGGSGTADPAEEASHEEGNGFGMGFMSGAKPLGYIEVQGENSEFIPIVDKTKLILPALLSGILAFVTLLKLTKAIRK